jgi:hypothetical protein
MFCQRDFRAKVVGGGGGHVLTAKGNQPGLATDLRAGLAHEAQARRLQAAFPPCEEPPPPPGSLARAADKGHGRLEVGTLRLTSTLTKRQEWAGLRQGFELTRERAEKGRKTAEVVHGVTSLSRGRADAGRLLAIVRGHWGVEINQSEDPSSAGLCAA